MSIVNNRWDSIETHRLHTRMAGTGVGIPVKLLHEAEGHVVTVRRRYIGRLDSLIPENASRRHLEKGRVPAPAPVPATASVPPRGGGAGANSWLPQGAPRLA